MHAEDKLLRLCGPGKCPRTWAWIKGKPLKVSSNGGKGLALLCRALLW